MIERPLRIDHSGDEPVVIDDAGYVVVCRAKNSKTNIGIYHKISPESLSDVRPLRSRCFEYSNGMSDDMEVVPQRLSHIPSGYRQCRWKHCGGDHERNGTKGYTLKSLLNRMSVEQFDRLVEEAKLGNLDRDYTKYNNGQPNTATSD